MTDIECLTFENPEPVSAFSTCTLVHYTPEPWLARSPSESVWIVPGTAEDDQ